MFNITAERFQCDVYIVCTASGSRSLFNVASFKMELMAEAGEFVLKLGEDPTVISIDQLGPALFNREGDWTSSGHHHLL